MDLMLRRRELMAMQSRTLDTTPKIAEYGKHWNRTFGSTTDNANWCITEWYDVNDPYTGIGRTTSINGFIGVDAIGITFQYYLTDGFATSTNWYYFNGVNPRILLGGSITKRLTSISFSVQLSEIDNSYAYIVQTGQILFAGKNTPYYGHRNISELA